MSNFVAIDFETASYSRTSACAVGLVHVRGGEIVTEKTLLIRPPQRQFNFTHIHGLTWADVENAPTFAELWNTLGGFIAQGDFLVAHNAPFDRGVLQGCCKSNGLRVPSQPFVCTVQLARKQWGIFPTKLPDVCGHLDIPLNHHDAGSDSLACAKIVMAAEGEGWRFRDQ
jgi:DNA polymerase-3 subunit epsilon